MKHISKLLLLMFSLIIIYNSIYSQWVQTNGPFGGRVSCFAVSTTNVFAGTDGGVFRSGDNGENWVRTSSGLTNQTISSIAINGADIFAGTSGDGVFRSSDNGENWVKAG